MDCVNITGIELMSPPHETTIGHEILAYFAADLGPVRVKGCALVKKTSGKLAAWLPNLHDKKARNNRSITLIDKRASADLLEAAVKTYRQMGGTDAPEGMPEAPSRVAVPVTRRPGPIELPDAIKSMMTATISGEGE